MVRCPQYRSCPRRRLALSAPVLMYRLLPLLCTTTLVVLAVLLAPMHAAGQHPLDADTEAEPAPPMYYVTERLATVYRDPDGEKPYFRLRLQDPVWVEQTRGQMVRVRSEGGLNGYLPRSSVSNVWVRVSKTTRQVYVYRGTDLYKRYAADFGYNGFADKERRGSTATPDHWRTPEGVFYVARKNPRSKYYKAFVLNYPTARDARRGLQEGLISEREYDRIKQADLNISMPPMNTRLGGWIEIHGDGTGEQTNWTQGCVAIENQHMDEMWSLVSEGTPVLIEK